MNRWADLALGCLTCTIRPELDKLDDSYQLQFFRRLILPSHCALTTWVHPLSISWLLSAFLQSWGAMSKPLNTDSQKGKHPPFLPSQRWKGPSAPGPESSLAEAQTKLRGDAGGSQVTADSHLPGYQQNQPETQTHSLSSPPHVIPLVLFLLSLSICSIIAKT